MKRAWHTLKGNKGCETAHHCIYFDTETKLEVMPDGSERDHLWFGWLCARSRTGSGAWSDGDWRRFTTPGRFWNEIDELARAKTRTFIFCHNTSYDLPVVDLFGQAVKRGWKLMMAVIEAPPTIITFRRNGATITFVDTLNWWRMPLAKLGDRMGVGKLSFPDRAAPRETWDTYCRQDVEVLRATVEAWLDFLVAHDLGGFATTLAGQAFRTYRHRFMKHDIVIDADDRSCALARAGYHGGRVEAFKLGRLKGPIHAFDINSMYPAVMRRRSYPRQLLGYYSGQDRGRWQRLVRDYCIVALCRVRARLPSYPLPSPCGLSFPVGEFETVLTTPEISMALARGELISMGEIAVYEKAPIFDGFVNFMWKQRRLAVDRGDEVASWLFKIMSNSLYGKFGQTGQVYENQGWIEDTTCQKFTVVDHETRDVYKCRQLAGLFQIMSAEGEARDSFPAIAAHVTGHARLLLWKLIAKAGLDNVYYCDTDSLFVNDEGARRLQSEVEPTKLGKLKHLWTHPWIVIHGLKDYEFPGHTVRKGVRADAVQLAPNVFRQTQWSSLKGLLGKGDLTAPGRKQIIKTLKREYKKPRSV